MGCLKEKKFCVHVVVLAAVLGLCLGIVSTVAVMQWARRIPSSATLKLVGVSVYKDSDLTVPVTSINWGIVEPSGQKNFSAYIKNKSNVPITLSLFMEDWTPANASSFIILTWNYDGSEIPVDGSIPITFVLDVSATISGIDAFTFTIVIVGSG